MVAHSDIWTRETTPREDNHVSSTQEEQTNGNRNAERDGQTRGLMGRNSLRVTVVFHMNHVVQYCARTISTKSPMLHYRYCCHKRPPICGKSCIYGTTLSLEFCDRHVISFTNGDSIYLGLRLLKLLQPPTPAAPCHRRCSNLRRPHLQQKRVHRRCWLEDRRQRHCHTTRCAGTTHGIVINC